MSLTTATNIAQSALNVISAQTEVLTRNIAGANATSTYSTKIVNVATSIDGGAQVASIVRVQNQTLFDNLLSATSSSSKQSAISAGLDQIETTVGTSADGTASQSPSVLLANFVSALQSYDASPSDSSFAGAAVSAAKSLVSGLNSATTTVQTIRQQADSDIAASVTTINSLLQQFQTVNNEIVRGTVTGADTTDAQDARDELLKQLSEQIGITTVTGNNNTMNIYTDSGVTLFQGTARTVSFTPTTTFTSGTTGNALYVDGVPVTGPSATMGIQSGKLAGLVSLRDNITVTYQNQLDEIAGSLISNFAESDQSGGGGPDQPGLFTTVGSSTLPTSTAGLAGLITVNASVDPSQGGNAFLLRDGGISDPSGTNYTYNTNGDASYSDRISQLLTNLSATQSFGAGGGITSTGTISDYAGASVSWLETQRTDASSESTYQTTLLSQSTTALSNGTGVNIDSQMSHMLTLEQSYQASAKLMATINSMFQSFMSTLGVTG